MPGTLTAPATESSADRHVAPMRRRGRRLSGAHVLVLAAGLVAGTANWVVLSSGGASTTVLVAATDLIAGQRVGAGDVLPIAVDEGAIAERLLPALPAEVMVAATNIRAGEPLRPTDLLPPAARSPRLRRMSLPVDAEHAVGGALVAGDRVDVHVTTDGRTRRVVTNAEVVAVADQADRGFGALGRFHLTLLVDADQALCLASALDRGQIDVVLATGADVVAAQPCQAGS